MNLLSHHSLIVCKANKELKLDLILGLKKFYFSMHVSILNSYTNGIVYMKLFKNDIVKQFLYISTEGLQTKIAITCVQQFSVFCVSISNKLLTTSEPTAQSAKKTWDGNERRRRNKVKRF